MPPLQKLVRKEAKVAIGIRDGQATYYERDDQDLRILGLPILMELLQQHGVRPEDHSDQNRRRVAPHVDAQGDDPHPGAQVALNPGWRLSYMDATDTSQFVNLRMTGRGMEVIVHCSVVESDLFIFMSTPQGFFQGGWKSIPAGMGNWESIRYHPPGPSLRGIPCRTSCDERHHARRMAGAAPLNIPLCVAAVAPLSTTDVSVIHDAHIALYRKK
jgi:hypothetical protein